MPRTSPAHSPAPTVPTAEPSPARQLRYGVEVSLLLAAAFALSAAHTVYAWLAGIEDPDFTVTTPLAWGFYAVAFGAAWLARRDSRAVQVAVTGFLVALLAVAMLYYPTTFTQEQQTVFGWVENDLYVGLLLVALHLSVLRLRRVSLVP